jgi:hypothetical protein
VPVVEAGAHEGVDEAFFGVGFGSDFAQFGVEEEGLVVPVDEGVELGEEELEAGLEERLDGELPGGVEVNPRSLLSHGLAPYREGFSAMTR